MPNRCNGSKMGPGDLLQDILRPSSPSRKPVLQKGGERALSFDREVGAGPRPVSVQLLAKQASPDVSRCLSMVRDPSPPPCYLRTEVSPSISPVNSYFPAAQYDSSSISTPSDMSFSGFLWRPQTQQKIEDLEGEQSGKHQCTMRLVERGIMMDCGKPQVNTVLSFGWSQTYEIPWAAITEACVVDTLGTETKTAFRVVRLRIAKGSSAARSAEIDIHVALEDADHSAQFLSSVRSWKRWQFARRCRTALDGGMSPDEVALSDFAGLAIEADAGSCAATVPHSLSRDIQAASLSRQRYFLGDDQDDQIPRDRKDACQDAPPAFASKISESSLSEASTQSSARGCLDSPATLELQAAWIHWASSEQKNASVGVFRCSVLCIDKLGLTARPHAAVQDGRMSDLIHISMSSILWIGQQQRQNSLPSPKKIVSIFADIKSASAVVEGAFTMGRLEEEAISPDPPHPHVVRVEVRSLPTFGSGKLPPKLKGKAAKSENSGEPMMIMTISVRTQREADLIMRAAMEHRRHQLLAAIRTSLPGSIKDGLAISRTLGDDRSMSRERQGGSPEGSLSPPRRPPRPATLPPANQLPQMVASSRGEVFWHLPPTRARSHQQTPRRGDATPPWVESPGGAK